MNLLKISGVVGGQTPTTALHNSTLSKQHQQWLRISSDFENGIYICIITNQITNQQQIRKLIIQKDE